MTRDEMIRMAREAGCVIRNGHAYAEHVGSIDQILIRFAAAEREACARVCDIVADQAAQEDALWGITAAENCADAIRARGQA